MPIRWFRRAGLALAISFIASAASADPQVPGGVFGAESFMLPNGLMVVAIPNHRAPVVSHMVWYKIGSAD